LRFNQGEDIAHAAINIEFAAYAHRYGMIFGGDDMRRFSHTLLYNIFQDTESKGEGIPDVAGRVDGSGQLNRYQPTVIRWAHLLGFHPDVMDKMKALMDYYDPHITGMSLLALHLAEEALDSELP
jgi:hypothetical protein